MLRVLLIHGGVSIRPRPESAEVLERIADAAWAATDNSVDAVVEAVRLMEEEEKHFNAGLNSSLQSDGEARMTAAIMESTNMRFAAVFNIRRVRNPILVAKTLLDAESPILAGEEATAYARNAGFEDFNPVTETRRKAWLQRNAPGSGTVGATALDDTGALAAATSTGGRGNEQPGRVSDSGMPPGNYANEALAVSCTGWGEHIIRVALASNLAVRVKDGMAIETAVQKAVEELNAINGRGAFIALSASGQTLTGQSYGEVLAACRRSD